MGANNRLEDDRRPIPEDLNYRREKDMTYREKRQAELLDALRKKSDMFDKAFEAWGALPENDFEGRAKMARRCRKLNEIGDKLIEALNALNALDQAS